MSGQLSLWLLSSPSESRIGRLPLLVVTSICCAVIFFSIAFGAVQWSLAGKMGQTLERVVSENINALSISQRMTSAMGNAHRFTISAAIANNEAEKDFVREKRAEAFTDYSRLLTDLIAVASPGTEEVIEDFKAYKAASDTMYSMVQNGQAAEAIEFRTSSVRPAFEAWQEAQTKVGNELLAKANAEKEESQKLLRQMNRYLVWAIILPILIGVACLVLVNMLIVVQMSNSAQAISRDIWGG